MPFVWFKFCRKRVKLRFDIHHHVNIDMRSIAIDFYNGITYLGRYVMSHRMCKLGSSALRHPAEDSGR